MHDTLKEQKGSLANFMGCQRIDSLAKPSWAVEGFSCQGFMGCQRVLSCQAFMGCQRILLQSLSCVAVSCTPPGGGGEMILDGAYILGEESAALMEKSGCQIVIFSIRDSR